MKSMTDQKDKDGHWYYAGGIPVGPQARRMGYEFPVHVSKTVWKNQCMWRGASRLQTTADKRIFELLQSCYDGMLKRLTQEDDFVFYYFKTRYWPADAGSGIRKKKRARLGARLFLDPSTEGPWLYIFDPEADTADQLEQGDPPDEAEIATSDGVPDALDETVEGTDRGRSDQADDSEAV